MRRHRPAGGRYRRPVPNRDAVPRRGRHDFAYTVYSNPPDVAAPLPLGAALRGRIDAAGQHARYTFHANAGQTLTVSPSPNCNGPLVMRLDDPGQFPTLLCGGLGPERIDATGEHSLTVFAFDRSTGDFGFTAALR